MTASMRHEDLSALQGRECRLEPIDMQEPGAEQIAAVLIEVGARRERQGFEQFSMLFRAAETGTPRQGTYAVTFADDDAKREFFLVPVERSAEQVTYEACFNRRLEGAG